MVVPKFKNADKLNLFHIKETDIYQFEQKGRSNYRKFFFVDKFESLRNHKLMDIGCGAKIKHVYLTDVMKMIREWLNWYFLTVVLLLILFRIGAFVYFVVTQGQYLQPDSLEYVNLANNLLEHQVFSKSLHPPFEINFFRTPGYPFFLAILKYLGVGSPYWVVFWQELLYGVSIGCFYFYGQSLFGEKIVQASVLFLLIEPGGLAFPKLILSETLFLPFVTTSLLLIGHYLKKRDCYFLVFSGCILGLGVLIRPALMYLPIIICFTLIAFDYRCKLRWIHSGLLLLTVILIVSPWIARNLHYSNKIFISGQQSNALANYHVPYVWELSKGIPFREGQKVIATEVATVIKQREKQEKIFFSKIERFSIQQDIAIHELLKYPFSYGKQWSVGFFRAMLGTNLTALSDVLKIQYAKVGLSEKPLNVSFSEKLFDFLKELNGLTIIFLILRGVIAVFAILALPVIFKDKNCFRWIIVLANFYFMFAAGPFADSRFRFPIEIFWFAQAGIGFSWLFNKVGREKGNQEIQESKSEFS